MGSRFWTATSIAGNCTFLMDSEHNDETVAVFSRRGCHALDAEAVCEKMNADDGVVVTTMPTPDIIACPQSTQ